MPLNLAKLNNDAELWLLEDEKTCEALGISPGEVGVTGVPCTYAMRRAAAQRVGVEVKTDGDMVALQPWQVQEVAVETALQCFKSLHGITNGNGQDVPCNREHIQALVDNFGDAIVAPAVSFFQELFEERKRARQAAEGN